MLTLAGCTDQLPVEAERSAPADQLIQSEDLAISAAKKGGSLTIEDITGTIADDGGTFEGTFTLTNFVNDAGQLVAQGTLTGTLTDASGEVIDTVIDVLVNIPVTEANGTCDILHLELGPIDLDLLGLVVHVDQIVVDIDAEAGSGNLLGNLLCTVAHLLDNPNTSLTAIANLLNNILGALG